MDNEIPGAPTFSNTQMNKKDLLVKIHGYVSSDGGIYNRKCKDIHGRKLRVRMRLRTKFYNKEKTLIEDFCKTIKELYPWLKSLKLYEKRLEVEIRNDTVTRDILKLGKVWSANWEIPKNINKKQKAIWIRAFADGEGTVYNKNYNRYVAIDSINLQGLREISEILKDFKIYNKIYTIKYKGNTSYRLKISKQENMIRFNSIIGFNHPERQKRLIEAINSYKHTNRII